MNSLLPISLTILVCITASESQVVTPEHVYVPTNGSVELSCPADTTSWLRSERESLTQVLSENGFTVSGSELTIDGFRGSLHAGQYFCVATIDGLTTVSCPVTVTHARIQAGPFPVNPVNTTVIVNNTAVLTCKSPFSEPAADYYWKKNDIALNMTDPRFTVLSTGNLYITTAQLSDAGEYQCIAMNSDTEAKRGSTIASLTVSTAPQTPTPAHNITATPLVLSKAVGEAAVFECVASGHPPPLIRWEKLHSRTFPVTAKVLSSGSLVIDPVTSDEGGVYRCIAENELGQHVYTDVELAIKGPPAFTHTPPANITLGETTSLTWRVQDVGSVKALLFRNGYLLDIVSSNEELSHTHILSTSEEGLYQCLALGSHGCARNTVVVSSVPTTPESETTPTSSPPSEVTSTISPTTETTPNTSPLSETTPTPSFETDPITTNPVTTSDNEQSTPAGSGDATELPVDFVQVFPDVAELTDSIPLELVCVISHQSILPTVLWSDPSGKVIQDTVLIEDSEQSSVTISVSVPGTYTCEVRWGSELQTANLYVRPAPLAVYFSEDIVTTRAGEGVELMCVGEGSGVTVEWWRGSQSLGMGVVTSEKSGHRLLSNYPIDPVGQNDTGDYVCRVSSPYFPDRTLEVKITLSVLDSTDPTIGPPLNVSVEHSSEGGVVISWDPPQTKEALLGYKINWGKMEPISLIVRHSTDTETRRFFVAPFIFAAYGEKVIVLVWAYSLYADGEPVRAVVSPFREVGGTTMMPEPEPKHSCTVLLTGSHNATLKFTPHTLTSLSHTCTEAQVTQVVDISMVTDKVLLEGLLPSCMYTFNVTYANGEEVSCDLITPSNEVDISASVQRYSNGSLSLRWILPQALRSNPDLIVEVNWGRGWVNVTPGEHFPLEAEGEDSIQLRFQLADWVGMANITIPTAPTVTTSSFDPTELGLLYGVIFGGLLVLIVLVLLIILSLKYVQVTRRENDKISDEKEKERDHFRRMSMERVSKNSIKRPANYLESRDNTYISDQQLTQ